MAQKLFVASCALACRRDPLQSFLARQAANVQVRGRGEEGVDTFIKACTWAKAAFLISLDLPSAALQTNWLEGAVACDGLGTSGNAH